jgi:hypothetical protein
MSSLAPVHGAVTVRARSGRLGAVLGLLSLALLAASFRWAHHWGVRADLLVSCWSVATIGALWFSIRSLRASRAEFEVTPALAKLGLVLVAVSLVALVVAGIAAAAGMDVAGACGGG